MSTNAFVIFKSQILSRNRPEGLIRIYSYNSGLNVTAMTLGQENFLLVKSTEILSIGQEF
jgi:hypothetical protein